ncbi:hypothetical protein FRB94_011022 [Tulasnella sp. JGI-2019a]|nr:hypothetical protein FRB94_011022 [Tulasnella sp. JGI-2019a]
MSVSVSRAYQLSASGMSCGVVFCYLLQTKSAADQGLADITASSTRGELLQENHLGERPQEAIVNQAPGFRGRHIRQLEFTEAQLSKLTGVIFFLSKADRLLPDFFWAKICLRGLKYRFGKLTPEHQLDIQLLVLLVETQEGWNGLRNGILGGDISYFT